MNLGFDAIFYYVSDLDRAIQFYRDVLGFSFLSRDAVARFHIGGVLFEVVPTDDKNKFHGSGNGRLCLRVEDIGAAVAALRTHRVCAGDPRAEGQWHSLHFLRSGWKRDLLMAVHPLSLFHRSMPGTSRISASLCEGT